MRVPNAVTRNAGVVENIIDALRAGAHLETAADYAGVSKGSIYNWVARGNELLERSLATGEDLTPEERWYVELSLQVNNTIAQVEMRSAAEIRAAAQNGDWRAAAWMLEHRFKERWSPRSEVHTHKTTGTTTVSEDALSVALEQIAGKLEAIEAGGTGEVVDATLVEDQGSPTSEAVPD